MRNTSATRDSNNTSSSSLVVDFLSKAEGIVLCSAFAFEAVLIVVSNLLTIFLFLFDKKLRRKSLFLMKNMSFADVMLGAVILPLYVNLWVGPRYHLWTNEVHKCLVILARFFDIICSQASLISAVLISCERFYAIYWPLKHRTLSKRAYRNVIIMVWTLAMLVSVVNTVLIHFISIKHATSAWMPYPLSCLFIVCGCNIGIWRKFRHGNIASQQQNRASQNQRLTKTLLFVSVVAVLSWLPLIIANYLINVHEMSIPEWYSFYMIINVINYSNSFINPVVYMLRIPRFKTALGWLCLRSQAAMDRVANERRGDGAAASTLTPVMQLRTLSTDFSHLQLSYVQSSEQEVMDSRL